MVQAATLNFNGGTVTGCDLNDAKTAYTCASLVMAGTDNVVIASGISVTVNRSVLITYNQGLAMSGTATLIAKGDINVTDVPPEKLKINGGTIIANGGTFTASGQQNQVIVANITAASIMLRNSSIKVTGNLIATDDISISYQSTISGSISGTNVSIAAEAIINASINARGTVTLASRINVTGAINAASVATESAVVINGDVKVSVALTAADSTIIKGDVEGGRVTLGNSNATITGNALVDYITLLYHGRVQKIITCKAYTPSKPCSCVDNQSQYAENTVDGPRCGPGVQAGPHHFQITHPASALSCAPEKVTVKACADASCGTAYTNGATVVLSPGGATAQTGNTGSVDSTVAQYAGGTATLSLTSTPSTTGALVCKNSTTGNVTNCQMPFNSSGLQVSGDPRYAEDEAIVSISAVQASGSNPQVCVPLFANQNKTIKLKCSYANPASGTLPARIQGTNGTYVPLAGNASSACSAAGADVLLGFNSAGVATPRMQYADVGQVGLNATYTSTSGADSGLSMMGSGSVIVAPAKFAVSAIASPQRAGQEVPSVTVTAQNRTGATTPNFGKETVKPAVALGHGYVAPKFGTKNGNANPEVSGALGFNDGVLKSSALAWAETGTINITATLSEYMGVKQIGQNPLRATGVSNNVLFIPHHFQTVVDLSTEPYRLFPALCGTQLACPDTGADPRFVYSRQPFALAVTAQNLQGVTTENFDGADVDLKNQQVLLLVHDAKDTSNAPPVNPAGGKLTDGSAAGTILSGVPVSAFSSGVARQVLAYQFPGAYSPSAGATTLAPPTGVLLRANFTYPVSNVVTSNPSAQGKEAALTVVTGRLMVPNSYGSELLPIRLDVQVQYWDGARWRANLADGLSRFGKAQVVLANCLKQVVCSNLVVADQPYQFSGGVLAGNGRLTLLAPKVAGSVDVSVGGISYLPSSVGRVVFGVFKSGPVLYLREMY